ncbi:MAG: hypothetical protein NZ519_01285 [Bacteroidia bacterium]|nr:hypothetical protein [Bacteroidia bacterium]MDW8301347.1 hypothetical protein [Bacteroidia bacterium]
MRYFIITLWLVFTWNLPCYAQPEVSFEEKKKIAQSYGYMQDKAENIEAIYLIHLLRENPLLPQSRDLKLKLFAWIQDTDDVVVYYDSPEAKEIEISSFQYKKELLQQYLNGCCIYDLTHPDKIKDPRADVDMGMKFVCEAYEKIISTTNTPSHYYFEAQCEKYLGRRTAKGIAEAKSKKNTEKK